LDDRFGRLDGRLVADGLVAVEAVTNQQLQQNWKLNFFNFSIKKESRRGMGISRERVNK
jgi:hypothetical protein